MKSLVTIIIPTYKRGSEYLQRCINSVLNQTYNNWELLIIDDNMLDATSEYNVESFVNSFNDKRIKYISNRGNFGANYARNNGIRNANGEYIAFLDDDDEWMESKLEKQVSLFDCAEINLGLVYCEAESINEFGQISKVNIKHISGKIHNELLYGNFIGSTSFVMIKKDVFNKVGYFSEDLPSNQDWELYIRIAEDYELNSVEEVLVRYYIHSGERITTNNTKKNEGIKYIFNKYYNRISSDKKALSIFFIKTSFSEFKNKRYLKFLWFFLKGFIVSPTVVINYFTWRIMNKGEWY